MSDFVILTDSSADLSAEWVNRMDIRVLPLSFTLEDRTYQNWPDNRDMDPKHFYDLLRNGAMGTTSAINVAQYMDELEPLLQEGKDVLILAFSSGLSATYSSSVIAAEALRKQFPQRKIHTVDTLCASLGQGMLVYLAAQKRAEGMTIDEVRDWVEETKLHICHEVTVNDLNTLKRGGRISATTAVVGSMLQIKPIIHVDNEGHLINVAKCRGRNASMKALVDRMAERVDDPTAQTVFISHGDCLEEAQAVGEMVKERFGVPEVLYNYVGPVIGSHTGPGVIALFYLGTER